MLTCWFRHPARSFFTLARELFLILAVGVLGSQLLLALNGGAPIGSYAQAASVPIVSVTSFDLRLDPRDPAFVRSVEIQALRTAGGSLERLILMPTVAKPLSFPCQKAVEDTWHCPTPGLRVSDLEQVVVSGT